MFDALWSIQFIADNHSTGAGVVAISNGKIFGGGSQYIFTGEFKIENNQVNAEVRVKHYFGETYPFFGDDREFTMHLSGRPAHDSLMYLNGAKTDQPEHKVSIRLARQAELL
jgi:hypothetical protein